MSFDMNLVTLQRDLRKSLISEELRKKFDSILSQTFALQPPSELLKGLTPLRKLGVLRTALMNFEDSEHVGLWNPWVKSMFKFAEQTIQDVARIGPKPVTSTAKKKSTVNSTTSNSKASPEVVVTKPKPKARAKVPTVSKQEKIYKAIAKHAESGKPLFKASYIKCSSVNCSYCLSLFLNIPLTRCTHKSCVSGSWYPHVGERLWKSLVRYHDKPGSTFVPRKIELKDGQLPSCIEWKIKTACEDQTSQDSITMSDHSSDMSDRSSTITSASSKRSSSYTPLGSPSKRSLSRSTGCDWSEVE